MTKEQFLQSTIDYYSVDPYNRRCHRDHGCKYSPENAGKEGKSEGCAIGRHLTPEVQKKLDESQGIISDIITYKSLKQLLPEWMQEMDPDFLDQVQLLHDTSSSWEPNGLSERGKERVNTIINKFNLSMLLFKL